MSLFGLGRNQRTFRPKKSTPSGSKGAALRKHIDATLGSGNLREAVLVEILATKMSIARCRLHLEKSHQRFSLAYTGISAKAPTATLTTLEFLLATAREHPYTQFGGKGKGERDKGCVRNLLTLSPPLHQGYSLAASAYSASTPMPQEDTP
jgi:hypothetical protein